MADKIYSPLKGKAIKMTDVKDARRWRSCLSGL